MIRKKIVILGASINQIPIIRKAKSMGYETHVFAWQNDDPGEYESDYFYPISVTNKDLIYKECLRIKPKAITTISSDIAALTVARVSMQLGLVTNSENTIQKSINKLKTKQALTEIGLGMPRYYEIIDSIPEIDISFPLIVKPSDRSGCKGVTLAHDRVELLSAINKAREFSFERKAIVEEYISSDLFTAECISIDGNHKVVAVTKNEYLFESMRFRPYKFSQSFSTMKLIETIEPTMILLLNSFGFISGASNVEFFITNQGDIKILEVSPCMHGEFVGSTLVQASTGFDYLGSIISIACGNQININPTTQINNSCIVYNYNNSYIVSKGEKTQL